jgi:amino acid transporter
MFTERDLRTVEAAPQEPPARGTYGKNDGKETSLFEGAEIYGDIEAAKHYCYVTRGYENSSDEKLVLTMFSLKSRHVQLIALAGSIGTGLFLGIGSAFTSAGPLGLLLGYTITGLMVYAMMQSLGEMATWLRLSGAIPQFCSCYVDDALGFAVGWNVGIAAASLPLLLNDRIRNG